MKTNLSFLLRKLHPVLLLLLTIHTLSVFSQDGSHITSDITQEQFIKGCAQYRSLIIHGITDVFTNFNLLCDSLKRISDSPETHENIRAKMIEFMGITSDVEKDEYYFYLLLDTQLEAKDRRVYRKWLKENFNYMMEYTVLVGQDFIEKDYPYKLKSDTTLWEEVKGYQLQKDMTLVDIGTGPGHFPFIIALSGYEGTFHMTEIDTSVIPFLYNKLDQIALKDLKTDIHIITGKAKDAALDDIQADKIFFRETFHHLKHKKEILESIKKNIKPEGFVYVKEEVKDYTPDKKVACRKIIMKEQILQEFHEAGYKLIEDKRLEEYAFLTFSL